MDARYLFGWFPDPKSWTPCTDGLALHYQRDLMSYPQLAHLLSAGTGLQNPLSSILLQF